jgi:micrococcal nuclease
VKSLLAASLAALFLLSPSGAPAAAEAPPVKARVTWITDGDTISVKIGNRSEKVRLLGVDTPETNDVREEYRQAAYDARDWLIEKLKKKTVVLEADPEADDRDKHGRLLRYVLLDGENVNLSLVREGMAWATTRFQYTRKNEFKKAQGEAAAARRGVARLPDGPGRKTSK